MLHWVLLFSCDTTAFACLLSAAARGSVCKTPSVSLSCSPCDSWSCECSSNDLSGLTLVCLGVERRLMTKHVSFVTATADMPLLPTSIEERICPPLNRFGFGDASQVRSSV